jgi:hypothetical protein
MQRGKFIVLKLYLKRSQINYLTCHIKKTERDEKIKSKAKTDDRK